jgi:hypothetical protein
MGDLLMDVDGIAEGEGPASDDVYLGSKSGFATVADGGGRADLLKLAGFRSSSADIVGIDHDNEGTIGSVGVIYGASESEGAIMLLANQFEPDYFDVFVQSSTVA